MRASGFEDGGAGFSQVAGSGTVPDVPLMGDIDGDGRPDLIVWRPGTGEFHWLTSSTGFDYAAAGTKQWGSGSGVPDVPLLGDIDGDGKADLIVWRPGTGTFFWLTSSSGYDYTAAGSKQWGTAGSIQDVPLVTDIDHDGRADFIVWRPTEGKFHWLTSSTGYAYESAGSKQWGGLSDPAPTNQPPTVSAGPNQTISLPAAAGLNGVVTDDGLPANTPLAMNWSKVSGPGVVTFSSVTAQSTNASFSVAGTYVLRLTATDTALFASADVTIIVNPANQAPVVTAGSNQTITLPASASLSGTATDDGWPAGSALTSTWSKVSGPGVVTFGNINGLTTTASFSVAGTYLLQLVASDGALSTTATVTVTVIAANQPPTVSAGSNQTITLPSTASLNGSATDDGLPAGSTLSRTWSKLTGPGTVTFGNVNAQSTTASFSVAGTYVLQLVASDGTLSSGATVTITVNPANQPPVVSAGVNQTITLPASATLTGTVTDDGLPAGSTLTKTWSKISGPGNVTFNNASALSTVVSFAAAGVYVLQLAAFDGLLTSTATVAVTVIAANQAPTVSAGANQTIALPSAASLSGSATDDGFPAGGTLTFAWSRISGPGPVTFSNSNALNTLARFSVAGAYVLQITASDTALTSTANVTITVNASADGLNIYSFYVDSILGSDSNPGTRALPWRTVGKVNTTALQPGQSVGFRRGGLWREELDYSSSGSALSPVVYGAYDVGPPPILTGSNLLTAGWTQYSGRIWKAPATIQPNIIYFNGVRGALVASPSGITSEYQWYWASGVLYVWSPLASNPSTYYVAPGIEVGARGRVVQTNNKSYVTLDGLTIRDGNALADGMINVGSASVTAIVFKNCVVERGATIAFNLKGQLDATSITIDHCNIQNNGGYAISLSNQFTTAILSNNNVTGNGWGSLRDNQEYSAIAGELGNADIFGNAIYDNDPICKNGGSVGLFCHGIYYTSVTGAVANVHDNVIHDMKNGSGIKVIGSANVDRNTIYNNGLNGVQLGQNDVGDVAYSVSSNLVYGNNTADGTGAGISEYNKGTGSISLTIANNTLYQNGSTTGYEIQIADQVEKLTAVNNLMYASPTRRTFGIARLQTGTVVIDYNLSWRDDGNAAIAYNGKFVTFTQWRQAGFDSHGMQANPNLSDAPRSFLLVPGSPCIGTGVSLFGSSNLNIGAF